MGTKATGIKCYDNAADDEPLLCVFEMGCAVACYDETTDAPMFSVRVKTSIEELY